MNIFLVEDEPPILRSLKNTILSFHKDYRVIGTAGTGQAAMDFIVNHHAEIDVLITDIQIPILSGLELTKFIQENYPHILTVVLTGYNRFEYARTALQNGVFDYLLKPINGEELGALLEKAYARKCVDYLHNASPSATKSKPGTGNNGNIVLALFCYGPYPFNTADYFTEAAPTYPDLNRHFRNYLPAGQFWIIPGQTPSERNLLFFLPSPNFQENLEQLKVWFKPVLSSVPTVTVAIYPDFTNLSGIRSAAAALHEYLSRQVTLEQPRILLLEESLSTSASNSSFEQYHIRLAELLNNKSLVLFHTELKNYVSEMKRCSPTQQTMFHSLCELFRLCYEQLPAQIASGLDIYATVSDVISCSDSYQAVYDNLYSIFDSYFEILIRDMPSPAHRSDMILQIDAYIKENYTKDINTASIAEHFGFTPAYLSKLFRESRSVTPSAYLIQLRMEKAKELLRTSGDCRIKDVAAYVGYEDSLYFSKVFKKVTGLSPRQFIQSENSRSTGSTPAAASHS